MSDAPGEVGVGHVVPPFLGSPPNSDLVALAAGRHHSLGLKGVATSAVQEPGTGRGSAKRAILSLVPNPCHGGTELSFQSLLSGSVTMRIYDLGGRLIRMKPLGALGTGLHRVVWDGRDEAGMEVSPGLYFIRLESGNVQLPSVRALVIR